MEDTRNNVAETVRDMMLDGIRPVALDTSEHDADMPVVFVVPEGMKQIDLTHERQKERERYKPERRKGTDELTTLGSLIDWAGRFCGAGDTGVLFADYGRDQFAPTLTCIANWHAPNEASPDGKDRGAMHGDHRGVYRFPLSEEWKAWSAIAGKQLDKDVMGEFIEDRAKDILDPTPALVDSSVEPSQDWEADMLAIAAKLDGRFASYSKLREMSLRFNATEAKDFRIVSSRDSGEIAVEAKVEHLDETGGPIKVPNLFLIAIPIFENGPLYRMAVRLRYRLRGGLSFSLSIYDPMTSARHAFDEAVQKAATETGLPTFTGRA